MVASLVVRVEEADQEERVDERVLEEERAQGGLMKIKVLISAPEGQIGRSDTKDAAIVVVRVAVMFGASAAVKSVVLTVAKVAEKRLMVTEQRSVVPEVAGPIRPGAPR